MQLFRLISNILTMNYKDLSNPGVFDQPTYVPGKSIEDVAKEFNLDINAIDKLASNENTSGPSPLAKAAITESLDSMHLYPDGSCYALNQAIAAKFGLSIDNILVGNGSNELIELLGHVFLRPGLNAVVGSYSFIVYKLVARLFGAEVKEVPMKAMAHDLNAMFEAINQDTRMVFVASPNNPTGMANSEEELTEFIQKLPDYVILCFDEAYAEYLDAAPNLIPWIEKGKKILCLRTFSKIYGLGGLRVGYGYGNRELIGLLNRVRQPFNVNSLGQIGALAALKDVEYVDACKEMNARGRKQLVNALTALGFKTYGGSANFVLCQVGDGKHVFEELQKKGVIIRPLNNYNLPDFVRITIGNESENERVINLMRLIKVRD